jgi:hypothetical protein
MTQITKRAIPMFVNSNAFLKQVNKEYSSEFAVTGAKIGTTLQIRTPTDYTVSDGPALATQSIVEQYTPLTITKQKHVDLNITSADLALKVEEFDDLILRPAMNRLAGYVAADLMSLHTTIPNVVTANISSGTVSQPSNALPWSTARATLVQNSAPTADLYAIMDPISMSRAQTSLAGLFNPTGRISEMFDSGQVVGPALGISKWVEDQLTPTVTTGGVGTLTVSGANQTGTTITLSGATTSFNAGDIVTFQNVYAVNRVAHTQQAYLKQFVVTGTGTNTISIYPALTPNTGGDAAFATVSASPANGATVNLVVSASQTLRKNMILHPRAFTLATVDLPLWDKGVVDAARAEYDGISMRALKTYYPQTDQLIIRLDVMYGYAALRPEWAAIVYDV